MALFGRWRDWTDFRQFSDLLTHFNLAAGHWNAFTQIGGNFGNDMRLRAAFPRTGLLAGITQATLADGSALNPARGGKCRAIGTDLHSKRLIDQSDDSELVPRSTSEMNAWLKNYHAIMRAMPEEAEGPSRNQLAA
jgi:hypothetical protein